MECGLKAILKEGILCIDSDGDTIILDTGSPVSLGNGSTLDLDGVSIKTQLSILGHDWQAIEESVPFSVKALVGTDQIGSKSLCINLEKQSAIWAEPLNSGLPLETMAGVPVISAILNGKYGRFFFDTGASICYVTDEQSVEGCDRAGEFEDFHPMLGKFSTRLFTAPLNMDDQPIEVEVGILPDEFSMMMKPFGIDGIIGTNSILATEIQLDFTNNFFRFPEIVKSVPHDSWASSYDQLFEASFGSLLADITDLTMELVLELSEPTDSILDIGAGTGRMSIPLVECSYYVSALDPSAGMLNQLANRLPDHPNLELINSPVDQLAMQDSFNGALCVFTVSSYWLDETALRDSLASIYNALLPGGWLIIDRTFRGSFSNTAFHNEKIHRQTTVEDLGGDIYRYTEKSMVIGSCNTESANDSFLIRFWEEDVFLDYVLAIGFILEKDLSQDFTGSGASFYLLRKD